MGVRSKKKSRHTYINICVADPLDVITGKQVKPAPYEERFRIEKSEKFKSGVAFTKKVGYNACQRPGGERGAPYQPGAV